MLRALLHGNAIDTPRFNGVIKAGTLASASGQLASLDGMPHLYLVLWDEDVSGYFTLQDLGGTSSG